MKFFVRNGIGLYLIITLLFKLIFIVPIAVTNLLFYSIMIIGLVLFVVYTKTIFSRNILNCFGFFYAISLLNILYFLFLDIDNVKSGLYVLAKFSTGMLIVLGLVFNYDKYRILFIKYFKYTMLLLVIFGKLFANITEVSVDEVTRLSVGFNPNDLGEFGMLGVLGIINLERKWFKSTFNILLILFFALIVLLSGSKGAIFCLAIGIFLNFGISFRTIGISILFLLVVQFSSSLNYSTGINRLESNERTFESRDQVFENGIKTFQDNIWTGHGLDKYCWTDPKYWDSPELALQPHNTYLGILIMYGLFFGVVLILLILKTVLKTFKSSFRNSDTFVSFCNNSVVLILIKGFSESLIIGVNEFTSLLFWFALGVMAYNFSFLTKKSINT